MNNEQNVQPLDNSGNAAKPIVIGCANIAAELLKLYPSGLVLGECSGIVGKYGLVINWINKDGAIDQKRYKEDEELPIVEVKGQMFVLGMTTPKPTVGSRFFKGFVRRSV